MQIQDFSHYWIDHLNNTKKPLSRQLYLACYLLFFASWVPGILLKDWRIIFIALILFSAIALIGVPIVEKKKIEFKLIAWKIKSILKTVALMMQGKMKEELIRVFGKTDLASADLPVVDVKEEEAFQKKMAYYISDEIPDHPFKNYWDVFVMKHQVPIDIFLHVLSMYIFWALVVFMIMTGEIWPILFVPASMLIGNISHKFFEDTYIDPLDALASPRALISLHKIMFLYTLGLYGRELKKRQDQLTQYLREKPKNV